MSTTPPTTIPAAVDAWRRQQPPPSDLEEVLMLSYLTGLLGALERNGELSKGAVREVARAFEKHTRKAKR